MTALSRLRIGADEGRVEVCEEHGNYQAYCLAGRWSKCPVCASQRVEQRRAALDAALHDAQKAARVLSVGIPRRFEGKGFDDFVVENEAQAVALRFSRSYVERFHEDARATGRNAIFFGGLGTGKTLLASAIAIALARRGDDVLFIRALNALRRVKATWRVDAVESDQQAIDAMVKPDLLILDEVGVQFGSETEILVLYDVLNGRYEACRPTLLTSNLVLPEIKNYLGARVFDRLREGGGETVAFDWESWRGRVGTNEKYID